MKTHTLAILAIALLTLSALAACGDPDNSGGGPGPGPDSRQEPRSGPGQSQPSRNQDLASENIEIEFFAERIPGSENNIDDATWWGYNQSKLARWGDTVFMHVIHNDVPQNEPSRFTVYMKQGDGPWQRGADFPASRPGNLIIDAHGVLHAFVFQPRQPITNESQGSLEHYWFPNAASGDIFNHRHESVVEAAPENETVNIRTGAAYGADGTLAVAYGSNEGPPNYDGRAQHVWLKRPHAAGWEHLRAVQEELHDYYYPFIILDGPKIHLLPVQDDLIWETRENIYQKIPHFRFDGQSWTSEIIVDYTTHPLAAERLRLTEQSELFLDSTGNVHIIYKDLTAQDLARFGSVFHHLTGSGELGGWTTRTIDLNRWNVNWLRLIEVDGTLYYLATAWNRVFLAPVENVSDETLYEIDLPRDPADPGSSPITGIYPYIANPKTGTSPDSLFVDILLLSSDNQRYPNAPNFYLRIPKSEFPKLNGALASP